MKPTDTYQVITDKFIEKLRSGVVPWQRPWISPSNMVSKKPYRGINALLLGQSDFTSPHWVSFKQAKELGGSVRKGEHGTMVVFWKISGLADEKGNPIYDDRGREKKSFLLRHYYVFNLDQIEGVEAPAVELKEHEPIEEALRIAQKCPCFLRTQGFSAYYNPAADQITMPDKGTFRSGEGYFATLFHEMTHSTGHASRLNREGITGPVHFGSKVYSREELIAELGAAFLSNESGILKPNLFENSSAYLASWIAALEGDTRLLLHAASAAQRSADFILGTTQS